MSIPRGVEMMIGSIVKMLGLDPHQMMSAVEDIRKSLHSAAADMATIRRQNMAIMAHLGISEGTEDGERRYLEERVCSAGGQVDITGQAGGGRTQRSSGDAGSGN